MEGGTPRPWMTSPVYGEPHESWYECHEPEIPLPGTTDPEMGPLVRGIVVGAIGYPQEGRVEAPGAAAQRTGRSARRTRRVHGDTLSALLTPLWLARVSRRKRVETMATSAHRNRTRKACS